MAPNSLFYRQVASLGGRSEEYSITVPKASGRAYVVHTDDRKLWEEYVRADYDFCRMGESYRDLFDYVCGQWYLDEHKAIGVAFAVGLTMVAIVLLLFFWSTKRGQKRQRSLLKRQGRHGKGAAAAEEELGPRTHMPLSQADNVVVVLDGEKPNNHSPPAWEKNQKAADNHSPLVDEGGPSSESESGEPGNSAACHTGEFEIDVAQTVKLTTVRAAPA